MKKQAIQWMMCGACCLLSLFAIAGCGRGGAGAPSDQAGASSVKANPVAGTAAESKDSSRTGARQADATPANTPKSTDSEHCLADAAAALWARMHEIGEIEKRMYDYNGELYKKGTASNRARTDFHQRFYELIDATSGAVGWDNQRKTLATILAAHHPEIADRFDKGEFNSLLIPMLSHPSVGQIDRGDGAAPPVEDKAKACADYFADWVRDYADLYRQKHVVIRGLEEKTAPEFMRLLTEVAGVAPDAWLCGEGPDDLDFVERLRAALRKHQPEIADEMADFTKKRLIDSVKSDQNEVKRWLAELRAAQRDFKEMDLDGNGVADYWTGDVSGLFRYQLAGEGLELIPTVVAEVDGAPLPAAEPLGNPLPKPDRSWPQIHNKFSYFGFQAVAQDEDGKPLAQDTDRSGRAWRNRERFAVCAYPLGYGRVGRQTYLLTEKGTIWFKDTEGRPVARLPKDPVAEGWEAVGEKADQYVPNHFDRLPLAFHVQRLQHADAAVRGRSIYALSQRCAPSQPFQPQREVDLGDGSRRTDPERRPLTPVALEALLKMLDDPDHEVRQSTIGAVEHLGHEAVPPAAARLKAWLAGDATKPGNMEPVALISEALEGLIRLTPDAPELPVLMAQYLKDPKPDVRRLAAGKFGSLGPRAGSQMPALVEALSDADTEVVEQTVYSLEYVGPAAKPAVPRLAELAAKGDMFAFRVMKKAGASPDEMSAVAEKIVRNDSLRTIDKEVIDEIVRMGPAGIPLWERLLKRSYPECSYTALTQLGKLSPTHAEALSLLIAQLEHRWELVRRQAAEAVGNVGPQAAAAVPALKKLLEDEDAETRTAAAAALKKIQP